MVRLLILFFTLLFINLSYGQNKKIKKKLEYEKGSLIRVIEYDSIGREISNTRYTELVTHTYTYPNSFISKEITLYKTNSENYTRIYVRRPPYPDSSVTQVEYTYNEAGKPIRMVWKEIDEEKKAERITEYLYNEADSLTKINCYSEGKVEYVEKYRYDRKNRLRKTETTYYSEGIVKDVDRYRYDRKNRLIKSVVGRIPATIFSYDRKSRIRYTFFGKISKYSSKMQNRGKTKKYKQISFSKHNKTISILKNPRTISKSIAEYSKEGKLLKITSSDLSGKYGSSRIYYYNDNGDLVKITNEGIGEYIEYKYEYW